MSELRYMVILFGGSDEERCDLLRCPMEAVGPFATRDEATTEADRLPADFQPRVLLLQSPVGYDWYDLVQFACPQCGESLIAPWQKCPNSEREDD